MRIAGKLTILAITAVTSIGVAAMAFEPRPLPDYTAGSPYEESSWTFTIYEEDGSVSVMDYNLTLMDCMGLAEETDAQSVGCERQR